MKRKYYIRGVGVGVLMTAVILSIAFRIRMSDEDVIMRQARRLGIEVGAEGVDADVAPSASPDVAATSNPAAEAGGGAESLAGAATGEPATAASTDAPNVAAADSTIGQGGAEDVGGGVGSLPADAGGEADESEPMAEEGSGGSDDEKESDTSSTSLDKGDNPGVSKFTITVSRGMQSHQVANLLEDHGVVENGGEFNDYLEQNGYARRIRIGKYEITDGATFKEIAEEICAKAK